MEKRGKIILAIFILIILVVAIYFTFFFYYGCDSLSCFKSHQLKCVKTKFINDEQTTTWQYIIRGKENGNCVVEAKILQIKEGELDRKTLEGKSMECFLRIGNINLPEADLTLCHGRLKEDIQEIMIKNIHSQILSNIEDELKGKL